MLGIAFTALTRTSDLTSEISKWTNASSPDLTNYGSAARRGFFNVVPVKSGTLSKPQGLGSEESFLGAALAVCCLAPNPSPVGFMTEQVSPKINGEYLNSSEHAWVPRDKAPWCRGAVIADVEYDAAKSLGR